MSPPSADRARALTVRLHSVSSGVGSGMSTSGIGLQSARPATLTVEIHSAASGSRRWISTSEIPGFVGPLLTLTTRIHRGEDGFADRISSSEHAGRVVADSHSPLKYTGVRLAAVAVVHVRSLRCLPAIRSPSPLKTTALRVIDQARYPHGRAFSDQSPTRVSKDADDWQSILEAAHHPIRRRCSPSKYTVPRVVSTDGYPHGNARSRCSQPCPEPDRNTASRGIGERTAASRRVARRLPTHAHHRIAQRAESLEKAEIRRRNPHVANHAPALTVRMHSPSIGGRSRISTSRGSHRIVTHSRHSARMRVAPNRGNGRKPAPVRAHRPLGHDTHRWISQHFASSCRELSTPRFMSRAVSGHPHL